MKKSFVKFALIQLLTFIFVTNAFAEVTRQPYLQKLTSNSVLIRWQTDRFVKTVVYYGTSIDSLVFFKSNSDEKTINHSINITNLSPDTKYYYSVEGSEKGNPDQYFITAPIVGSNDSTRIWVISDFGQTSSKDNKRREETVKVWKSFNHNNPHADFVLSLGDQTEDDTRYQIQHNYFNQLEDVLKVSPLYTVEGNHDNHDKLENYYKTFNHPINGETGGVFSNTEDYYSFNYANIHVVVLSTEIKDFGGGPQEKWLRKDLANNKQDWLIACVHRPFHSGGHHRTNIDKIADIERKAWLPILEDYGVDIILQGHNHQYERSYLLDNLTGLTTDITDKNIIDNSLGREDKDGAYVKEKGKPHQGTIFIEVAAGGHASDDFEHYEIFPVYFHSKDNEGSLVIDVIDNKMNVKFLCTEPDSNNSHIWDYFTIIKKDEN